MQQAGYTDYPAHKAEHDALTRKALLLQKEFRAGNTMLGIDTMQFLKDWLAHHIGNSDRKYVPAVKSRRVA